RLWESKAITIPSPMPQASHSSIFPVRDWRWYVRSAIAITEIAVSTIPVNPNTTYPGSTTDSVGIQYGKRKKSKRATADQTANPMTDCSECFDPKGLRPVTISAPPAENMMVDMTAIDAAVSQPNTGMNGFCLAKPLS